MDVTLHDITFSNLFKYVPHRHEWITILLGLNPVTAFTMLQSKLITGKSWIQKPHNSQDGALCNNCKRLKTIDYYRNLLHLSYGRVNGFVSEKNSHGY